MNKRSYGRHSFSTKDPRLEKIIEKGLANGTTVSDVIDNMCTFYFDNYEKVELSKIPGFSDVLKILSDISTNEKSINTIQTVDVYYLKVIYKLIFYVASRVAVKSGSKEDINYINSLNVTPDWVQKILDKEDK